MATTPQRIYPASPRVRRAVANALAKRARGKRFSPLDRQELERMAERWRKAAAEK